MPYVKIISGLNFYTKKSRIKSLINHVFELKPENEIFLGVLLKLAIFRDYYCNK